MRTEKDIRERIKAIRLAYPDIDNEKIGMNPVTGFIHGMYCAYLYVLGEIEDEETQPQSPIRNICDCKEFENNGSCSLAFTVGDNNERIPCVNIGKECYAPYCTEKKDNPEVKI